MDPNNLGDLDEHDPKSVVRLMKRMGQEMGEDVSDIDEGMTPESHAEDESIDDTDGL